MVDLSLKLSLCVVHKVGRSVDRGILCSFNSSLQLCFKCSIGGCVVVFYSIQCVDRCLKLGDCRIDLSGVCFLVDLSLKLSLCVVHKVGRSVDCGVLCSFNSSLQLCLKSSVCCNVVVFYSIQCVDRCLKLGDCRIDLSGVCLLVDLSLKLSLCVVYKIGRSVDRGILCSFNSSLKHCLKSSICGNVVVLYSIQCVDRCLKLGQCRTDFGSVCLVCQLGLKGADGIAYIIKGVAKLLKILVVICVFCIKGDVGGDFGFKIVRRGEGFVIVPSHKDLAVYCLRYRVCKNGAKELDLPGGNFIAVVNGNKIAGGKRQCLRIAVKPCNTGRLLYNRDIRTVPRILSIYLAFGVSGCLSGRTVCCDQVRGVGNKPHDLIGMFIRTVRRKLWLFGGKVGC